MPRMVCGKKGNQIMALTVNTTPDTDSSTGQLYATGQTPPALTRGTNDPQLVNYGTYNLGQPVELSAQHQQKTLRDTVYDPFGPTSRPEGGRTYYGPWINPYDTARYPNNTTGSAYRTGTGDSGMANNLFKWNHMFMTMADNFDPFMQKKEAQCPHWWLNRIPRGAYPLFSGTIHETRIYRGGLGHYAGLADWEDLAVDPTQGDPCGQMPFKTYQYAWETLAWSGKKTAWGSDPICIEVLKFTSKAAEQLGWILETGVKFGTDIQNVWNRDMFIYYSVMAGRSFVMTNQYRGDHSPRYVYDPYVKFAAASAGASAGAHTANTTYVDKPFIVFDATADIQPLNFDVLDLVRMQLKRRCPEAAVGSIGNEKMFAIAVSAEDVEKYIRGNEEERRYWIEANPQALIQHYGFAPTTFRRWTITDDENQLRFKIKAYHEDWTATVAGDVKVADLYGGVGKDVFDGKAVYVAEFVPPEVPGRPGINGAPVPVPNDEYDLAELAIAPIFMNKVFTNLFVPDVTNLGSGTWFGPKKGLNGKWAWYNIQTPENPDNKIGNFKGEFHIVPKPETCVFDCISFLYRRCATPLPSFCPVENVRVNVARVTEAQVTIATARSSVSGRPAAYLIKSTDKGFNAEPGDRVMIAQTVSDGSGGTTATEVECYVYGESDGGYLVQPAKATDTLTATVGSATVKATLVA